MDPLDSAIEQPWVRPWRMRLRCVVSVSGSLDAEIILINDIFATSIYKMFTWDEENISYIYLNRDLNNKYVGFDTKISK